MSEVKLTVHPFEMGLPKESAVKVLEEAAESFAEWQSVDYCIEFRSACNLCPFDRGDGECAYKRDLADELADCIQACCNLADRYNIDLQAAMGRCEQRNRERGRY